MHFQNILKKACFILLASKVFANDCDEIKNYVKKHSERSGTEVSKCEVNGNGKVIELYLINEDLTNDEVNTIFSYDTITKASYIINVRNIDDANSIILEAKFTDVFTKLPNLEELYLDYYAYEQFHYSSSDESTTIEKGNLKLSKKLKKLTLEQIILTTDTVNEIATLTNLEELNLKKCKVDEIKYDSWKSLTNLKYLKLYKRCEKPSYYCAEIPEGLLKSLKSEKLSDLIFDGYKLEQKDVSDVSSLNSLKNLEIVVNEKLKLNDLNNLKNLNSLVMKYYTGDMIELNGEYDDNFVDFPVFSVIKKLYLNSVDMIKVNKNNLKTLSSMNGLEELTLKNLILTSDDVKTLANLSQLKKLIINSCNLGDNRIKSTDLVPNSFKNLTVCKVNGEDVLNKIKDSNQSENNDNNISANGKCGKNNGNTKCPSGQCCSKYGYCGASDDYCSVEKGCVSEFGNCNGTSTTKKTTTSTTKTSKPTSTNGKCGKDNGNTQCPSGQCCSKYGYCGTSDDHCSVEKGCNSEFGKCSSVKTNTTTTTSTKKTTTSTTKTSKPTSTDGKCGKDNGNAQCPSGQCCSKYGYCGSSEKHCSIDQGCQSEFGKCSSVKTTTTTTTSTKKTTTSTTKTSKPTSTDGKCGKDHGNAQCPSGQCCSKYGYCGSSEKHCSIDQGCQSEFGKCSSVKTTTTTTTKKTTTTKTTSKTSNPTSTDGKCGKDNGNTQCPSGQCCSKYGYCGSSEKHCSVNQGCQSKFGKCN